MKELSNLELQAKVDSLEAQVSELMKVLNPLQELCRKYRIDIEDIPDIMEEYISYDNEEYEAKLGSYMR